MAPGRVLAGAAVALSLGQHAARPLDASTAAWVLHSRGADMTQGIEHALVVGGTPHRADVMALFLDEPAHRLELRILGRK